MTGTQGRMITPEERQSITPEARATFVAVLQEVGAKELHHGDCVGADAATHQEAVALGLNVVIHPPTADIYRANCTGPPATITTLPPLAYITRNRKIVDAVDGLIVLPQGFEQEVRSGTWSTYRYARGIGRQGRTVPIPTLIIYPDGTRKLEGKQAYTLSTFLGRTPQTTPRRPSETWV